MALHEEKTCSCGGTLKFSENLFMLTQPEMFPSVQGWLNMDIYICESCRMKKMNAMVFCQNNEHGKMEFYLPYHETDEEKLERMYRGYSDKKLRKIMEDKEYREDARQLAERILKERDEQ